MSHLFESIVCFVIEYTMLMWVRCDEYLKAYRESRSLNEIWVERQQRQQKNINTWCGSLFNSSNIFLSFCFQLKGMNRGYSACLFNWFGLWIFAVWLSRSLLSHTSQSSMSLSSVNIISSPLKIITCYFVNCLWGSFSIHSVVIRIFKKLSNCFVDKKKQIHECKQSIHTIEMKYRSDAPSHLINSIVIG